MKNYKYHKIVKCLTENPNCFENIKLYSIFDNMSITFTMYNIIHNVGVKIDFIIYKKKKNHYGCNREYIKL